MVTSWGAQVAAKVKSKMSIFLMVLGFHSYKGHQQLCLAPTQQLFQRMGSQMHAPITQMGAWCHGASCTTLGEHLCLPLLISGGSPGQHSPLHRAPGGFQIPKQITNLPTPQALSSQRYRPVSS